MTRHHCLILFTLLILLVFSTGPLDAHAEDAACGGSPGHNNEFIATVRTASGEPAVQRGQELLPLHTGDRLCLKDTLITPTESTLGVIFRDDTILSMGPKTELRIDEFVFDPVANNLGMLTNMTRGTAQFISGQIAKLAPESVSVQTPLSSIGIRGTRFLVKVD